MEHHFEIIIPKAPVFHFLPKPRFLTNKNYLKKNLRDNAWLHFLEVLDPYAPKKGKKVACNLVKLII